MTRGARFAVLLAGWTLASLAAGAVPGCDCSVDPDDIDVGVECPDGKPASATMTIHAVLSGVRPLGDDKQIRVRGTRGAGESLCFADGGQLSFSITVDGDATVDTPTPPLAHGAWELSVVPLSGGDHPDIPPIARVLAPGVAHTLLLQGNADGDLEASITP